MAVYYDSEGNKVRVRGEGHSATWAMAIAMIVAVAVFVYWLYPDIAGAPERAVGGQAPKEVRGTNGGVFSTPVPAAATPIPGIAESPEEADRLYQAAIAEQAPAPLPLNSAGEPVISQEQQQQQNLSLQLAEVEGGMAVDQQLAAQRATANAVDLGRAPDVSYEDAKRMLGRDPCSVPRANPHTCMNGLYKPTPVN
jgi:hypothetical protein